MLASVKAAMKYGPPRSPKLREQMVSASHNMAPSMYTLQAQVIFTIVPFQIVADVVRSNAPVMRAV